MPRSERRSKLLEAAVRVAREEGPSVSMERIAREAGVTKPVLYSHFGDKAGLAQAVAEHVGDSLLTDLAEVLSRADPPHELLTRAVDVFLTFVEEQPALYAFLLAPEARTGSTGMSGLVDDAGRIIANVLGERLREAGADSGGTEPWAVGMVGMVVAAADWWVRRRVIPREALVAYLTELLWSGLAGTGLGPPQELPVPAPEPPSHDPSIGRD